MLSPQKMNINGMAENSRETHSFRGGTEPQRIVQCIDRRHCPHLSLSRALSLSLSIILLLFLIHVHC